MEHQTLSAQKLFIFYELFCTVTSDARQSFSLTFRSSTFPFASPLLPDNDQERHLVARNTMIICCSIDLRIELYHLDSLALTSKLPTLIFTVAVKGDLTPTLHRHHPLLLLHSHSAESQTGFAAEMYQLCFPDPLYQNLCTCIRIVLIIQREIRSES